MDIKYRILPGTVNHKEHSLIVRYYTDTITEDMLAVDGNRNPDGTPVRCRTDYNLTIWDFPATIDKVEKQIKAAAPVQWFNLIEYGMHNENALEVVSDSVGVEKKFTYDTEAPKAMTDEEIEELIKSLK